MRHFSSITLFSLMFFGLNAFAANEASVNKEGCARMKGSERPFMLVLYRGDDLLQSITQCAADATLPAASITGLGQLQQPTLAYFSSNPQEKPTLKQFEGFYELVSLNGDITNNNGKYYTHVHVALGDHDFRAIAGHVNAAVVGMTAEITMIPLPFPVKRTLSGDSGFGLIDTKQADAGNAAVTQ